MPIITRDELSLDQPFPKNLDPSTRGILDSFKQEHLFITGPEEEKEQFKLFRSDFTRTFRCGGSPLFDAKELEEFNGLANEEKNKNILYKLSDRLSIPIENARSIIAAYSQFVTNVVSTLFCARIDNDITPGDPLGVSKFVFMSGEDRSLAGKREFLLDVNIKRDFKDDQIKMYCTQSIVLREHTDEKFYKIPNSRIQSEFVLKQRKKKVGFQLEKIECPEFVSAALKGEILSLRNFIERYCKPKQPEVKHAATWSAQMFKKVQELWDDLPNIEELFAPSIDETRKRTESEAKSSKMQTYPSERGEMPILQKGVQVKARI